MRVRHRLRFAGLLGLVGLSAAVGCKPTPRKPADGPVGTPPVSASPSASASASPSVSPVVSSRPEPVKTVTPEPLPSGDAIATETAGALAGVTWADTQGLDGFVLGGAVPPGSVHGCSGVPESLCPKRLASWLLAGPTEVWTLDGRIYAVERNGGLKQPWKAGKEAAYQKSVEAGVRARFGAPEHRHDDRTVLTLGYGTPPATTLRIRLSFWPAGAAFAIELHGADFADVQRLILETENRERAAADAAATKLRCRCEIPVDSQWPQYNGHAMPGPDPGRWKVISVDPTRCMAKVKDAQDGSVSERSCAERLFDIPIINPAG